MSENIRSTNLRFNLDKDVQNRAWQYLQTMDKKKFKSYSQIIAISLVDYFDRYYKKQDEPYLETREREERFVEQIVTGGKCHEQDPTGIFGRLYGWYCSDYTAGSCCSIRTGRCRP